MDNKDYRKFYLIRDVLPESVVKTLKVKDALKTILNCPFMMQLNSSNLSRSAFYKYGKLYFL